jgi:hypothetical protein
MDNLTTTPQAGETCLSAQEMHVYRHVDSEKLQSKALIASSTPSNGDNRARGSVANLGAPHEKALVFANRSLVGGVLWIA